MGCEQLALVACIWASSVRGLHSCGKAAVAHVQVAPVVHLVEGPQRAQQSTAAPSPAAGSTGATAGSVDDSAVNGAQLVIVS